MILYNIWLFIMFILWNIYVFCYIVVVIFKRLVLESDDSFSVDDEENLILRLDREYLEFKYFGDIVRGCGILFRRFLMFYSYF